MKKGGFFAALYITVKIPPESIDLCSCYYVLEGFGGCSACADDHTLVISQRSEPTLNVSGAVSESAFGFKSSVVHQGRGGYLCHQFLLAVTFVTEVGRSSEAIQTALVAGAVGQLVKCSAIPFFHALELFGKWKHNAVSGRGIIGFVADSLDKRNTGAIQICFYDAVRIFVIMQLLLWNISACNSIALINVKHIVVAQHWDEVFSDFASLVVLILDRDLLPENDHLR